MKRAVLFAALLMTAAAPRLAGLTIPSYSYDELFTRSDLVIIAEPLRKTHDTPERSSLRDVNPPTPVIGVETEFQTALVLKGRKRDRFILHHYREPTRKLKDGEVIIDGLPLVDFDPKNRPVYLLFLVHETDGRFAPVAGQTFVNGVSIWQITYANGQ